MDDPNADALELETLPRYKLSLNQTFYNVLLDLLTEDQRIAGCCWMML